jgi:hypothetical protein
MSRAFLMDQQRAGFTARESCALRMATRPSLLKIEHRADGADVFKVLKAKAPVAEDERFLF